MYSLKKALLLVIVSLIIQIISTISVSVSLSRKRNYINSTSDILSGLSQSSKIGAGPKQNVQTCPSIGIKHNNIDPGKPAAEVSQT